MGLNVVPQRTSSIRCFFNVVHIFLTRYYHFINHIKKKHITGPVPFWNHIQSQDKLIYIYIYIYKPRAKSQIFTGLQANNVIFHYLICYTIKWDTVKYFKQSVTSYKMCSQSFILRMSLHRTVIRFLYTYIHVLLINGFYFLFIFGGLITCFHVVPNWSLVPSMMYSLMVYALENKFSKTESVGWRLQKISFREILVQVN